MKQILPKLKEVNKYLNFLKNCFTKPQFNHVKNYIGGLVALNKKTIKSISSSSKEEKDQSSLNRFLTESDWNEDDVQDRYVKKISHQTRGKPISLLKLFLLASTLPFCFKIFLVILSTIISVRTFS